MAGPLWVPAGHREHIALCAGLRQVYALHLQTWDQMGLGGWTSGGRSFCWAGPAGRVGLPVPGHGARLLFQLREAQHLAQGKSDFFKSRGGDY